MRRVFHLLGRAFRETGQALDRLGLQFVENDIYKETWSRHRPLLGLYDKRPLVGAGTFVAPNASVVGKVLLAGDNSVWYGAVIRGDKNKVLVGVRTNIQDRAVINTVGELEDGRSGKVSIGAGVTIGHGALLTSCKVEDFSLIGQGAIVQAGTEIGRESIIAAGAVVLPNTVVPSGQLWAGNPAKYIRDLTEDEVSGLKVSADSYLELSKKHSEEFLPYGTVYQQAEKL